MTLGRKLRASAPSPALAAAVVFGLSGVGFVAANLLLARALEPADYAIASLVIALVQIAMPLGPLGLDVMVTRRHLDPHPTLLARATRTSALTGAVAAGVGAAVYHLHPWLLILLLVSSVAGGANLVASAIYQSKRRFGPALLLSQSQNGFLAAGAVLTLVAGIPHAWVPVAVYAVGYVLAGVTGWSRLLRRSGSAPGPLGVGELFSLAGLTAVTLVLIQIERLVVPRLLSLEDLALFGVLAAIAASPFRVLQQGVGYTMLPRLRAATTVAERRKLLGREAKLAIAATAMASAGITTIGPRIVDWWLAGKYTLTPPLLGAAVVAGVAKVACAFATSAASALCSEAELARLRGLAWSALAVSFVACFIGARWGLVGVVYGAGVGWLGLGAAAGVMAAGHFREGRGAR